MAVCAVPGCAVEIHAEGVMCRKHWAEVPADMRRACAREWIHHRGQRSHRRAIAECLRFVVSRKTAAKPEPQIDALLRACQEGATTADLCAGAVRDVLRAECTSEDVLVRLAERLTWLRDSLLAASCGKSFF